MTRYNAKSADVLNAADRHEDILNWQLFAEEQDMQLFGYKPEIDWTPGDELYRYPYTATFTSYNPEEDCFEDGYHYVGNYVRPMIELLDDNTLTSWSLCEACQVSWDYYETTRCWSCGEISQRAQKRKDVLNLESIYYKNVWGHEMGEWEDVGTTVINGVTFAQANPPLGYNR